MELHQVFTNLYYSSTFTPFLISIIKVNGVLTLYYLHTSFLFPNICRGEKIGVDEGHTTLAKEWVLTMLQMPEK